MPRQTLHEPAREVPVIHECDICVIGGSCTGLFAAVRAARLGARVVVIEKQNAFGGTATNSLVNVWHSLYDTEFRRQIIGGLTQEVIERLERRGAIRHVDHNPSVGCTFNSSELKIELDTLAVEARIKVYFQTMFVAPYAPEGQLQAVLVENKSGRGAIRAKLFIDASGDGDLAARVGLESYRSPCPQPATTCALLTGWESLRDVDWQRALREQGVRFGLPEGFAWGGEVPGSPVYMLAGTRVLGMDSTDADSLTAGEMEGRRQVRAILDILRDAAGSRSLTLQALPSQIGLRESRHFSCQYQLCGDDVLLGRSFADTIALGSYRVDVHHQDRPGITLRYLDGTETYIRPGYPAVQGRWRESTQSDPTFYQIPYRSLVPRGIDNLLVTGRMIDADPVAHGAVRVMVNTNQTGEAAGVAAHLALEAACPVGQVDVRKLRKTLAAGGSIVLDP